MNGILTLLLTMFIFGACIIAPIMLFLGYFWEIPAFLRIAAGCLLGMGCLFIAEFVYLTYIPFSQTLNFDLKIAELSLFEGLGCLVGAHIVKKLAPPEIN